MAHIIYRNHRGETTQRVVSPTRLYMGSTEWHPERQLLLRAWDYDKDDYRDFAVKDIIDVLDDEGHLMQQCDAH